MSHRDHPADAGIDAIVAHVRQLQRSRGVRAQTRSLFVEGVRHLIRCHDHGLHVRRLIVSPKLLPSGPARMLTDRLRRAGVPTTHVSPEVFRRITTATRASGVGLVIRTPVARLMPPGERALWVAAERVRSPGNLGTILRTSAAVGARGLVCTSPQVDPFCPDTVRGSMGAIFAQQIVHAAPQRLREWATRFGVVIIGATGDAVTAFDRFAYPPRCVIVVGDERKGLSDTQRDLCDVTLRIPMAADVDSLNVGVAASLMLYRAAASAGEPGLALRAN